MATDSKSVTAASSSSSTDSSDSPIATATAAATTSTAESSSDSSPHRTGQVQGISLQQYLTSIGGDMMQFYAPATAAHSEGNPNQNDANGGQSQAPVQVHVQQPQQYFNPAIAYQQWFQQQIAQQAQQTQSAHQQDGSFPSPNGDGNAQLFASPYLDPNQNLDFHSLTSNGQTTNGDGGLSISALQNFANSLQHGGQGQAFMFAVPSSSNNGTYLTMSHPAPSSAAQQQQQHSQQPQQPVQATPPIKKKPGRQPKSAGGTPGTPHTPEVKVKPPKPKGTPNAYAIFYKEAYPQLRNDNPDWKASQIMTEAGRAWKSLSETDQDRYRTQALGLQQANCNSKSAMKKAKNTVKRPMTAYQLFIREHFNSRPAEIAQMHAKDFLMRLSVQWKNLDEAAKKDYQDRAKLLKTTRAAEAEAAAASASLTLPVNGTNGVGNVKMEMEEMEIPQEMMAQQTVQPAMIQYYQGENYGDAKKEENW